MADHHRVRDAESDDATRPPKPGLWRRFRAWLARRFGAPAPTPLQIPAAEGAPAARGATAAPRAERTPPAGAAPETSTARETAQETGRRTAPRTGRRTASLEGAIAPQPSAPRSNAGPTRARAPETKPERDAKAPPAPRQRAPAAKPRRARSEATGSPAPFRTEAEGYAITGVERAGAASDTALILIHGAGLDHRDWTFGFIDHAPPRARILAFDRPGFGGSGRPRLSGPLPATQARLLRAAAAGLGVRRAILIGHSWGGAVAMSWGLQDPDMARAVVSLAGAVAPWSLASSIEHNRRMRDAARTALSGAGVRQAALEAMAESFAPADIPSGYLAHVETKMAGGLLEGPAAALAQDIATINGALGLQVQRYGDLARPVELVYGDADRIVSAAEQADVAAAALPDARVTLLKGAGHMIQHTHAADCWAAIARAAERAEADDAALARPAPRRRVVKRSA